MEASLKIRKAKFEVRMEDKDLHSLGRLTRTHVCLATALDAAWVKGPLIVDNVRIPDSDQEDE